MQLKTFLLSFICASNSFAQIYTGKVSDQNGKAITGAEIQIQSTLAKVLSDANGQYILNLQNTGIRNELSMHIDGSHLFWNQARNSEIHLEYLNTLGQILQTRSFLATMGQNQISLEHFPQANWLRIDFGNTSALVRIHQNPTIGQSPALALSNNDSITCQLLGFKKSVLAIIPGQMVYDFTLSQSGPTLVKIPETGFELSLSTIFGEDNDYTSAPMQFQTLSSGILQDKVTGLIWTKSESPLFGLASALNYCDTLSLGGLSWRLPDAHEAYSIQHLGKSNPSLDTTIWGKSLGEYWWTSTVGRDKVGRQWLTNMGGGIGSHDTLESKSVGGSKAIAARCVAGIAGSNFPNWKIISDSIAEDLNTGLQWTRFGMDSTTWESAIVLAEGLQIGGFNDWRLPNIKELQSINNENNFSPSLDTISFWNSKKLTKTGPKAGQIQRPYWSSTGMMFHADSAWMIDYNSGLISYANRITSKLFVIAVRGGKQ